MQCMLRLMLKVRIYTPCLNVAFFRICMRQVPFYSGAADRVQTQVYDQKKHLMQLRVGGFFQHL